MSFQSAEYNHYWWDSYDKNHLAQDAGHFPLFLSLNDNDSTLQSIWKSPVYMTITRAMLSEQDSTYPTNDGFAATKKWFVKMNLSW